MAAVGEPSTILPPLVQETVGRDIGDLVFERLADLAPGKAPIDSSAYRPALASRWERVDSLTWRFHLRPGARWQDGHPVSAEDVRFSFEAFSDTVLGAAALSYLAGRVAAEVVDSATVLIRFTTAYPEQLYDATYHVRVIPAHLWRGLPRSDWAGDTSIARLAGSGPYSIRRWERGQFLVLEVDTSVAGDGGPTRRIGRVVWRFSENPDAALTLLLAHDADLLETTTSANALAQAERDSTFRVVSYPSAVFGFVGFRLSDRRGRPHAVLGDRSIRRALTLAIDRQAIATATLGPGTVVPPGPMSRLLWIGAVGIRQLPFDTAEAARLLDSAGWHRGSDGMRARGGKTLRFSLLVPGTSLSRRQAALALREQWRAAGVDVSIAQVDFPVFQERLGTGHFDAYVGAYLDEPTPRGLIDQWTRSGWDTGLNYGRYDNPVFDSLVDMAGREADPVRAAATWRAALDTLNADAPAVFLYSPTNHAVVQRRVQNVQIDPFAWLRTVPVWRLDPRQALPRDSFP